MPNFFGFVPSETLLNDIKHAQASRHSSEPLYPLRDKISLAMVDEILQNVLADLLHKFPASDKKETAEKLMGYVKATVNTLLKTLLGKADNAQVQKSIDFLEQSLFIDANGKELIGTTLPADLVANLKTNFDALLNDGDHRAIRLVLKEDYKKFADLMILHFLINFTKTLDLGMIKRKASDIAASAVTKAVHIAIDKLFPTLNKDELKILAETHGPFFHSN